MKLIKVNIAGQFTPFYFNPEKFVGCEEEGKDLLHIYLEGGVELRYVQVSVEALTAMLNTAMEDSKP
jgi:hypothetical protein